MNFITKFAVNTILKKTHPTLERKQCINIRPHKANCTACIDICPVKDDVFRRAGIVKNWNACIDCGLCVGVCPTRCIVPAREQVERDVTPVESPYEFLWVGCEKSNRQNDLVRPCICAFSWETLSYFALCKKTVLDLTPCAECENEICAAQLRKTLERVVDFLGESRFEARIALAYEEDEFPYVKQEFSRRDFAGSLVNGSKQSSRQLMRKLPFLVEESEGHMFDYRMLLNQRAQQLKTSEAEPPRYGVKLPVVNDKCYGCDKCTKACRAGAIEMVLGEDGFTRMVVTPWKCCECELCQRACNEKAIEGFALRQMTSLAPVVVRKLVVDACPNCGKGKKKDSTDELCLSCRVRERSLKRKAEAEERAAKRAEEIAAKKAAQEAAQEAGIELPEEAVEVSASTAAVLAKKQAKADEVAKAKAKKDGVKRTPARKASVNTIDAAAKKPVKKEAAESETAAKAKPKTATAKKPASKATSASAKKPSTAKKETTPAAKKPAAKKTTAKKTTTKKAAVEAATAPEQAQKNEE